MPISPADPDRLSLQFDRSGAHLFVSVEGDLDLHVTDHFTAQVTAKIDATLEQITVDVSKLAFCDFSGLDAIVAAGRHAATCGATLGLHLPSDPLRELIAVAGVSDVLPLTA
ncbi:MAG: anti-sigma factor antagonist [Acidimicrobiales bacterium]|nr:anti-sigma factor antagonist [Acidimicrobiales bacterium]